MKTFDRKDVYSWRNAEDAKQYIGKEGYFSNNFSALKIKVRNCDELTMLKNIDSYGICCFNPNENFEGFGLFLPADKIKDVEEEKKYRPFKNVDEFIHILGVSIGEILIFRPKKKTQQKGEIHTLLVGYLKTENGDDGLIFGGSNGSWSLQDIFENLEWKSKRDGQWRVFGVEE